MKTVIITGVSQGLGKYIANTFLKNNWQVIGTGRSKRPTDLAENIQYKMFDASDAIAVNNFWKDIDLESEFCLVNNAGGYSGGPFVESQAEDFNTMMQSNYFASVNMTRGLVQNVKQARIININSSAGLKPLANASQYAAAKAAARQFFASLQEELPQSDYQITNLYPSLIDTHGLYPNNSIAPVDLAELILELANSQTSYFMTDITLTARVNKKENK